MMHEELKLLFNFSIIYGYTFDSFRIVFNRFIFPDGSDHHVFGYLCFLVFRSIHRFCCYWLYNVSSLYSTDYRSYLCLFTVSDDKGLNRCSSRYFRTKVVEITDERVKLMSEIIKSMRIVKMYCWESAFIQKICHLRK